MDFFDGFKWAVPTAFADAVSLCRFEEGDILYDTKMAYGESWGESRNAIEYSVQVRHPARSSGGVADAGKGLFDSNWRSEIYIDLYKNLKKTNTHPVQSTQGRLYTALWRGDAKILDQVAEEPALPLSAQDATKSLEQAKEVVKGLCAGEPAFMMARDLSNPVSRDKYNKLTTHLKSNLPMSPLILTPKHAGLADFKCIAPTVDIAIFQTINIGAEELHDLVKKAVYVKAKSSKKDMFRISAHGVII